MSVKLLLLHTWHVCWVMAAYKTALHIDSSQVVFCCLLKFWSLISTSSPIYLSVFTCMQYECVIISFPNEKLNFIVGIAMGNLFLCSKGYLLLLNIYKETLCRNVAALHCSPKMYEVFKCAFNPLGPNNQV